MINCIFESGGKGSLRHVVVHAIVVKDGSILLVKRANTLSLEAGKWALPGGFLDRDETLAQAVLRELKEETGWQGEVVTLFRINSNPDRPHEDRQNVAFDFIVKPTGQVGQIDRETSKTEWVSLKNLPPLELLAFDHGESVAHYLRYQVKPFPLPLFF